MQYCVDVQKRCGIWRDSSRGALCCISRYGPGEKKIYVLICRLDPTRRRRISTGDARGKG